MEATKVLLGEKETAIADKLKQQKPLLNLQIDNMETLMRSLLGRNEEFVLEKLQSLIRSEEPIDEQNEEIDKLKRDLEKFREENHNLKNKLE